MIKFLLLRSQWMMRIWLLCWCEVCHHFLINLLSPYIYLERTNNLHLRSYWHFFVQKERRLGQIEASTPSTIMSAFSAQFKGKDKQKNASNVSKRTNSDVITTISLDTSRDIAKKNKLTWHVVKWNQGMKMLPKELKKKQWVILHLWQYIIYQLSL